MPLGASWHVGWFLSGKKGKGRAGLLKTLHSGGVGMKINLFVAVTIYKFCRAVLYTDAQFNSEVT